MHKGFRRVMDVFIGGRRSVFELVVRGLDRGIVLAETDRTRMAKEKQNRRAPGTS